MKIDTSRFPDGSIWSIYSRSGSNLPRVTITSPDFTRYIGREGETVDTAMTAAIQAYRRGDRE